MTSPLRISAILSLAFLVNVSRAQSPCLHKQLLELSGFGGQYGTELGFDGSIAAISTAAVSGTKISLVRVYERDPLGNWSFEGVLAPTEPLSTQEGFGPRIFVSKGRIAVAASTIDPGALGSLFIFEKTTNGWSESAKLTVPGHLAFILQHVAFDGDTAVLVGPVFHPKMPGPPTAHFFEQTPNGWVSTQQIVFSDWDDPWQACIDGDLMVIRKFDGDHVIEYIAGAWQETQLLAYNGDNLTVNDGRIFKGSKVFEKIGGQWIESNSIPFSTAPGVIAVDGNVAIRVAPGTSGTASVCYYEDGSWVEKLVIHANGVEQGDGFGSRISVSGGVALISSPWADDGLGHVGVFDVSPNQPAPYGSGCPGTSAVIPKLSVVNSYDGCVYWGSSISLTVEDALGGAQAVLLIGIQAASVPVAASCTVLVDPLPFIVPLTISAAGQNQGSVTVTATLPIGAGSLSVYMQGFVADAGVANGYSGTNGARITIN